METLGFYFNKGKQDALNHLYQRPHGLVDIITTWKKSEATREEEENNAYEKGYFYTRGREDAKSNFYAPPEMENHKAAYEEGFNKEKKLQQLHLSNTEFK